MFAARARFVRRQDRPRQVAVSPNEGVQGPDIGRRRVAVRNARATLLRAPPICQGSDFTLEFVEIQVRSGRAQPLSCSGRRTRVPAKPTVRVPAPAPGARWKTTAE